MSAIIFFLFTSFFTYSEGKLPPFQSSRLEKSFKDKTTFVKPPPLKTFDKNENKLVKLCENGYAVPFMTLMLRRATFESRLNSTFFSSQDHKPDLTSEQAKAALSFSDLVSH